MTIRFVLISVGLLAAASQLEARGGDVDAPPAAVQRQAPERSDTIARTLPIVDIPSEVQGPWLALFITGDGGYVSADRRLVSELTSRGIAVVVLDARAYLRHPSTPGQMSHDMAEVLSQRLERWGRSRVVLIGSSRGADVMPFLVNRFPDALRSRVMLMVLFGLGQWASFEFHWADMVMDRRRPTDLPVLPEVERLRGIRILCVYGEGDKGSFCHGADSSLVVPVQQGGGHRLHGATAMDLADLITKELSLAFAPSEYPDTTVHGPVRP